VSYILGSTVPLTFRVYDADGQPINAATNVLAIELPDGTIANPAMDNTETGVYALDYVPLVAGRFSYSATTTVPAASFAGVFDVRAAMPRYMVSLSSVKKALNMRASVTSDDNELLGHIEAATDALELYLHETVVRRTVVERHDLGHPAVGLLLNTYPVVSITSIVAVDGGQTWTGYSINARTGVVYSSGSLFSGSLIATYVAGRADVPANYSRAAEIVVASLWQSQRIPVAGPRAAEEQMDMDRYGVVIPPRARELLGGTAPMVGA
jgi:hypothetical protein